MPAVTEYLDMAFKGLDAMDQARTRAHFRNERERQLRTLAAATDAAHRRDSSKEDKAFIELYWQEMLWGAVLVSALFVLCAIVYRKLSRMDRQSKEVVEMQTWRAAVAEEKLQVERERQRSTRLRSTSPRARRTRSSARIEDGPMWAIERLAEALSDSGSRCAGGADSEATSGRSARRPGRSGRRPRSRSSSVDWALTPKTGRKHNGSRRLMSE